MSARLSKKTLDELPVPVTEYLYASLWRQALPPQPENALANHWLSLLLLADDLLEFDLHQLVSQDIYWLGLKDTAGLHSFYFSGDGDLNREHLVRLLTEQLVETYYLPALDDTVNPGKTVRLAYLADRRLNHVLPWMELLDRLKETDLQRFPQLARLAGLKEKLAGQGWLARPIAPEALPDLLAELQTFLLSTDAVAVMARCKTPRPVRELIIVEGETEKLLLPVFAESMKVDFNALGIYILPAGGKNHVMALYKQFSEQMNAPIFVMLDGDATEVANELQPILREQDCVYQISEGEFEDTYDLKLILKTINQHYQPYPEVTPQTFQSEETAGQGRVQILKSIWQSYGLGSFDKVEFAGKLAEMIQPSVRPPDAMRLMLETLLNVREGLDISPSSHVRLGKGRDDEHTSDDTGPAA